MAIQEHIIPILTDAAGAAVAKTIGPVNGLIELIRYVPDATTPLDTGADITITGENSGIAILAQSNIGTSAYTKAPRQATHDTSGAAALYAAAGSPVLEKIAIAGERVKIVVAQGGNALKGNFIILANDGG